MTRKNRKDDDERRRRVSRYIRVVRAVFKACRRQRVPLYSSKFSRRDFTQWQHIALLVLWQRMRKSYREYVNDLLPVADTLVEELGLSKLPHFTTLQKFMLRVSSTLLERVMGGFVLLTRVRRQVFGIDSSGFSMRHASYYYALRVKRDVLSGMRRQLER
ncbi:MAG: hypothetical protein JRM77_10155 [Nitrososphaerota archaeon]|nr:hypothetical protein [Nitrososphaerota archaeon]